MIAVIMQSLMSVRLNRASSERGASMVEYALLVGLIAIVAVVALLALGPAIANLFQSSSNCVVGLSSSTCP
jgi:pilus assembly protein Flp/PilA